MTATTGQTVSVPQPLLDALGALHHVIDQCFDEMADENRNIACSALRDAAVFLYGPVPDDNDPAVDEWDGAIHEGFDPVAATLIQRKNDRYVASQRAHAGMAS
jgi:hypothetical protein